MDSYTLGGAGAVSTQTMNTQTTQIGYVVGQTYAASHISYGSGIILRAGFWVEVASEQAPVVVTPNSSTLLAQGIQVQFQSQTALVSFQMERTTPAKVRLVSIQGNQIGALWNGTLSAGPSQIEISLRDVGTQPLFLLVEAGNARKTFRFTPNFDK